MNKFVREVLEEARRSFPEYFDGKSDEYILSEILNAVQQVEQKEEVS